MKELCGEAILPIFGEYSYIRQNNNSTDRPSAGKFYCC